MRYEPKPLLATAPCIPSELTSDCKDCARKADWRVETTKFPVIDATKVAWPDGVCPMRELDRCAS